jgi:hypothetical protein
MNRRLCSLAIASVLGFFLLLIPPCAWANVVLTYTGIPYTSVTDHIAIPGEYATTMYVSVTIELANALGPNFNGPVTPIHYSFSDGRFTVTDLTPGASLETVSFTTDGSGGITQWYWAVDLVDSLGTHTIESSNNAMQVTDYGRVYDYRFGPNIDLGANINSPGLWSSVGATILTYIGNRYTTFTDSTAIPLTYNSSMYVSAAIELPAAPGANLNGPVTPTHYSFSDGRFTVTDLTPGAIISFFDFTTDGAGTITGWQLSVGTNDSTGIHAILTYNFRTRFNLVQEDVGEFTLPDLTDRDSGLDFNSPGIWSTKVAGSNKRHGQIISE